MKFCYTYDNMERLLTATVERDGTGPVLLCGNTLDELSLSHDGNQLRRVTDQCAGLAYEGAMDYRGDVRAVVADDGTLEEVNHYYPYGMLHGPSAIAAGVQPFRRPPAGPCPGPHHHPEPDGREVLQHQPLRLVRQQPN